MTRTLATAAVLLALFGPTAAVAAEPRACLTAQEQKVAISQGKAVTLAAAMRAARVSVSGRTGREAVKARLCREDGNLVYVLTVLARDGKVTHTTVDAGSGKVVDAR